MSRKKQEFLNNSAYFILPVIGRTQSELRHAGFVNSFLRDKNRPIVNKKGKIFVYALFQCSGSEYDYLQAVIEEYKRDKVFEEFYEYKEDYKVIVLVLPKEFEQDFDLFLEGKYSELSSSFTNRIPKTCPSLQNPKIQVMTTTHRIINKEPSMKKFVEDEWGFCITEKDEYWYGIDLDKETLNIE